MAINIRKYESLGKMDIDWLSARYHFSFSGYHDPQFMGLGALRVINDDAVKPHSGFDFHPHSDMEIITYVRSGAISHQDSLGNKGATKAGEVQVMSAGTGIIHAEHNNEDVPTKLYQIWIRPHTKSVEPRWEHRQFPKTGGLQLLVSGDENDMAKGALFIHADAKIFGGVVKKSEEIAKNIPSNAYLLISEGEVWLNDQLLAKGDGAAITGENIVIKPQSDAEILLIELQDNK